MVSGVDDVDNGVLGGFGGRVKSVEGPQTMSQFFFCPYLGAEVELTDEREQHIRVSHPGTLPDYRSELVETLAEPDLVRPSDRDPRGLRFSKWFDSIRTGRYFVVVTISDSDPTRHWMITAYTARKLARGS